MTFPASRGCHLRRKSHTGSSDFEGEHFDEGFRVDIFVEGKVIIELKSVEKISTAHKKQLLTYLKLTNTKLGLILNFGAATMLEGIDRIANEL